MTQVLVTAHVANSHTQTERYGELISIISDMNARIENTQDFDDKCLFFAVAFDGGFECTYNDTDDIELMCAHWSVDFPELNFEFDFVDPQEDGSFLWRLYVKNGKTQKVLPYQVVPDCDMKDW